MLFIDAACCCHIGKVRVNNQDNFLFNGVVLDINHQNFPYTINRRYPIHQPTCFAVFDGMGGEAYGERAAFIAANTFKERLNSKAPFSQEFLSQVCLEANHRICKAIRNLSGTRMGTTAAAICFTQSTAHICNIGDSKIFLLRNNRFSQLSIDHIDQTYGDLHYAKKAPLTQHLGVFPSEMIIEPYEIEYSIQAGDIYLICSDGLTDMLNEEQICDMLHSNLPVVNIAARLVQLALEQGGRDNITAILCAIQEDDA